MLIQLKYVHIFLKPVTGFSPDYWSHYSLLDLSLLVRSYVSYKDMYGNQSEILLRLKPLNCVMMSGDTNLL